MTTKKKIIKIGNPKKIELLELRMPTIIGIGNTIKVLVSLVISYLVPHFLHTSGFPFQRTKDFWTSLHVN
jgi:hypothetical protein